jgi:hypothetical protein
MKEGFNMVRKLNELEKERNENVVVEPVETTAKEEKEE